MPDLLQDFETYFIASSVGTEGHLFRDTMPNGPDECSAIYEYGGNTPLPQIAGALRSVQVVARSVNATEAKNMARAMYHSLKTEEGIINLTAERWGAISLKQPPFKMKVDEKERVYYCFNLDVVTYED